MEDYSMNYYAKSNISGQGELSKRPKTSNYSNK